EGQVQIIPTGVIGAGGEGDITGGHGLPTGRCEVTADGVFLRGGEGDGVLGAVAHLVLGADGDGVLAGRQVEGPGGEGQLHAFAVVQSFVDLHPSTRVDE